jgi:hypothetical protein
MTTCDSQECIQALTRLQLAKNEILSLCSQLEQLRASAASFDSLVKLFLAIASAMLITAGALSTIPIIGWILAAVFVILAAIATAMAAYFASRSALINGQINDLEKELAAARDAFANAVAEVMATCPPECWGELDQPTCP